MKNRLIAATAGMLFCLCCMAAVDNAMIPHDGLRVWTIAIKDNGKAVVGVECKASDKAPGKCNAKVEVLFGEENLYWFMSKVKAGESFKREITLNVPQPWSPETPVLYRVVYTLYDGKTEIAKTETTLGIRTTEMNADKGFLLNGKELKLKGICMSEQSPLDANKQMDEGMMRQIIKTLQDMGCNILRTETGMPSPTLCKLCDETGMMLLAEPVQTWAEADSSVIVQRVCEVRNRPSVVIWSAGNETKYDCADEETANAKKVCATIKAMDPTRPMTAGLKQIDCAMRSGLMEMLDIAGLNNSPFRYKEAQLKTPQHKVLGTMCNATKEEVEMMKENDWVAGEFVQEDLIQLLSKTDKYYYYRSLWNDKKHTLHLTSHWNHQEGEKVSVRVMTDLKSVELMVNGKSAGKTDSAAWHDISFEKGELKAVGYDDKGKNVMTTYLRTAEEAVHAEVVPEYAGEMTFVEIRIVDAKNTVCPMFEGNVKVQAEGDGQLVAQLKDNELQPIDAKEADIKVSGGKTTIMVSGNMKLTVLPDKLIGAILDINHNK